MNLSPHFTIAELTLSDWAIRHDVDNAPSPAEVLNLTSLALQVLEPIRTAVGLPVTVLSGYRNAATNAGVGGDPNSDHMRGNAADIVVKGLTPWELAGAIRGMGHLPIKRCIIEFGRWVHVARRSEQADDEDRPQFLVATRKDGETKYTVWRS